MIGLTSFTKLVILQDLIQDFIKNILFFFLSRSEDSERCDLNWLSPFNQLQMIIHRYD